MYKNTCLLYNGVNEVYQKLHIFCSDKGFKVKESKEKFYFLRAKKSSFFFWRTLRLEVEILTVEKEKVQVTVMLYKNGKRQAGLENEYIIAIENFF
ncbi:MAG TPA: hypothetical protein VJY62_00240 [Bacteroidia bacterium]|nr:hypothetical protein [Bacteroidia bacterium]